MVQPVFVTSTAADGAESKAVASPPAELAGSVLTTAVSAASTALVPTVAPLLSTGNHGVLKAKAERKGSSRSPAASLGSGPRPRPDAKP